MSKTQNLKLISVTQVGAVEIYYTETTNTAIVTLLKNALVWEYHPIIR